VIAAALVGGMEAVVELPMWTETLSANPSNRARLLAMDTQEFIDGQKHWLNAYIPVADTPIPGLKDEELAALALPTLIFRSGKEDEYHPEFLSLELHRLIPGSELVDPPWGEGEWNRVKRLSVASQGGFFDEWPRLAPQILDFLGR
jgi:2-hydroxy-6-oxonona-2,4-dienedioate hydrolase